MIKKYSQKFYSNVDSRANYSTKAIVNILKNYINFPDLNLIVDVGCGSGAWINCFLLNSTSEIHGYDLIESIELNRVRFRDELESRVKLFVSDFENTVDLRLPSADLGVCLEVLEHLENKTGKKLVQELSQNCDIILFSAATPGQGGTGHINEQEHNYWLNQFKENGFDIYDCIRPKLQNDSNVARYYALNTFLLIKSSKRKIKDESNIEEFRVSNEILDFRRKIEQLQFYLIKFFPEKIVTQLSKILSH
jgi:SAM-dependent methyltransferase